MNSARVRSVGHVIGGLVSGLVVGAIGTVAHRAVFGEHYIPYGIVLALLTVLLGGVCMRAWAGYVALVAYGIGFAVCVQVLALEGPGGDVLIPDQTIGLVWIIGGLILVAVAFFLPRSWFMDVPLRRSGPKRGRVSASGATKAPSESE